MAKNTTEQELVNQAEIVDEDVNVDEAVLTEEEFLALPEFVQGIITAADDLQNRKIQLFAELAANRTIMRAFRDSKTLKSELVEYYYPTKERGPRLSPEDKAARLRAQADELEAA